MSERCEAAVGGTPGRYVKCNRLAFAVHACLHCDVCVWFCRKDGHEDGVLHLLDWHKLRAHPELMHDALRRIARDPERLGLLRENVRLLPERFARLVEECARLGITL